MLNIQRALARIVTSCCLLGCFSALTFAQTTSPYLSVIPSAPTAIDAVVIQLTRPLGTCEAVLPQYYISQQSGNLISIVKTRPLTGGGVGIFATCSETFALGRIQPGRYRIEWREEFVAGSGALALIAAIDLQVLSSPAMPIPTSGTFTLMLLSLSVLGLASLSLLVTAARDSTSVGGKNS